MAEPSTHLWQALLALADSENDQELMWHCESGKASLIRAAGGVPQLDGTWSALDQAAWSLYSPLFTPLGSSGRFALAQLGQSLDGRIATPSGDSYYINGQAVRAHLHRLRALVDAVLIGAGTAISDQPALTVRHCAGTDPVPVIIDPKARVPMAGPLFDSATTPRLILIHETGQGCPPRPAHVETVFLANNPSISGDGLAPADILQALAERGLRRTLIEGGGVTVSRFIDSQALDRLHLLIAPLLIGSGPTGVNLTPIDQLAETPRRTMHTHCLDGELMVDLDLAHAIL